MTIQPDLTLQLHLFPTEAGGRKASTPKYKFNCMFKILNEYHDCQLVLVEVGSLSPGQTVVVPAKLLRPELLRNRLTNGQSFTLCEGRRE